LNLRFFIICLHKFKNNKTMPALIVSCRSCEFYDNDCPETRGRFVPYPCKVCKRYSPRVFINDNAESQHCSNERPREITIRLLYQNDDSTMLDATLSREIGEDMSLQSIVELASSIADGKRCIKINSLELYESNGDVFQYVPSVGWIQTRKVSETIR